jgi:RNA polymerase sigma factor (sigma-70 family)
MAGRLDAITRLYDRYARTLVVFFHRRIGDPDAAIDLMSETFTIAAERYDAEAADMGDREHSHWLWSIARGVLRDHDLGAGESARVDGHQGDGRRGLADAEIERIEELSASAKLRGEVACRLDILDEPERQAVHLRVVEGLPYAEVAARLELTDDEARSRVELGLRRLRHMLSFEIGEDGEPAP